MVSVKCRKTWSKQSARHFGFCCLLVKCTLYTIIVAVVVVAVVTTTTATTTTTLLLHTNTECVAEVCSFGLLGVCEDAPGPGCHQVAILHEGSQRLGDLRRCDVNDEWSNGQLPFKTGFAECAQEEVEDIAVTQTSVGHMEDLPSVCWCQGLQVWC